MLESIIDGMGCLYPYASVINEIILGILAFFGFHRTLFVIVGFFTTRKFKPAEHQHKYAILIPARNEEDVIANLLESIRKQDYPSELLTVFVVADNCTDNTAKIAREQGAICYERFDNEHRTKGYALEFLFENIERDYGISSFEGYFVFDSDNLLNKDYITKMNDAFDSGQKIITSYRNTKNFDENWVASTYALHWLRSIRFRHRARSVFRLATNIQGTGFLFANELVKDGWHYTSLTEDRAFTADAVAHGYQISYQDAAVFYDEQPVSIRIAFRQRIRWAKGHLLAFRDTGWALFKNILLGNRYRRKEEKWKWTKANVVEEIRHRIASFDTLSQLIPGSLIRLTLWLSVTVLLFACYNYDKGIMEVQMFEGGDIINMALRTIFDNPTITIPAGAAFVLNYFVISLAWRALKYAGNYIASIPAAIYVFIVERKRIIRIPFWKKVFYSLTWPVFDSIGRYSTYIALFMKVTWKPIPHKSKVTIQDIKIAE